MNNKLESFYSWYRGALRHPKYRWLIILGTATYLLSPLDISPDVFPVIGWLDDGILATLLVTELSAIAMDFLKGKGKVSENEPVVTEEGTVIDVEAS